MLVRQRDNLMRMAAAVALALAGFAAYGQHAPLPHGSADAVTVEGGATSLPAGHPALGEAPATMPAGHPAIGGTGAMPAVPPGHPGMGGAGEATSGAFRVVVSPGTKGAPAIGADAAKVELFARGKILKTYPTSVEKGRIELHDLPLAEPFQPVVSITHDGVVQQLVGPPMGPYQAAVEVDMPVYESTDQKPAWTLGLMHIAAEPEATAEGGVLLRVTEMLGGHNPLDKAWIGDVGPDGQRRTLVVTLPDGATGVILGQGLLENRAEITPHAVVRHAAMLPGTSEYVLQYVLPVKDGHATLTVDVPAETSLLALYAPASAKVEKIVGLEAGEAQGAHATEGLRLYKAKAVPAGSVLTLELSGIKAPEAATELPADHPAMGGAK